MRDTAFALIPLMSPFDLDDDVDDDDLDEDEDVDEDDEDSDDDDDEDDDEEDDVETWQVGPGRVLMPEIPLKVRLRLTFRR